jgi:hypothetical protein
MPTPKRVKPWLTLSVAQGNAVQVGGLLGAVALAWYAGREGPGGARWMVASRLLAYVSEHAFPTGLSDGPWASASPATASTALATLSTTRQWRASSSRISHC